MKHAGTPVVAFWETCAPKTTECMRVINIVQTRTHGYGKEPTSDLLMSGTTSYNKIRQTVLLAGGDPLSGMFEVSELHWVKVRGH
jgi:hypothetical protein